MPRSPVADHPRELGRLEARRQAMHMALGGLAFLLHKVPWWQAAALAALVLVFAVTLLPRTAGRLLFRPGEVDGGLSIGMALYALAVLLLILVFPRRPDIAGAAWAILTFGDGAATMVGIHAPRARIPWNRDKTVAGSLAFAVAGGWPPSRRASRTGWGSTRLPRWRWRCRCRSPLRSSPRRPKRCPYA